MVHQILKLNLSGYWITILSVLNLKCSKKENRPLVILALPQLYEHQLLSKEQHFAEIEYLVSTISKYSTDVLVSLHPKMDKVHYLFLEKKYNVVIAEQNLIDIIHLAKIFISTYSSTVLWSVALGIPSIIVDFYTLNYSYFKNFKGVGIFSEKQSFEAYLVELLKFGKLYKSKEIDQIKDSKNTVMDGNCISNLIKLINEY